MLVTKREVKQTSKKLLSVLLALVMMMTSMSVCFGTFVASAEDVDHMQVLADKLKDSSYSNTLSLLAAGKDSGSGVARKVNITFSSYINYKQAAELLRLVDNAMKASECWAHLTKYNDDQQSACEGRTTQDIYNELIKTLAKKGANTDDGTDVQKFLRLVLTWDGAVLHSGAVKSKSQSTWTNTITFSTSDYKGYLAQVGKAANVASSVETGVKYTLTMPGNLYYGVAGSCGSTTKYYHNMFWPKSSAVNAPATNGSNTEMKSKVDEHVSFLNGFINMTYAELLNLSSTALDNKILELNTGISDHITYVGGQSTYDSLYADYATGIANFRSSVQSAKDFANYMPTVDAWNEFVDANPNYGVFQYPNFGEKGSATQVKLLEDFATFKAYRDYLLTGGSIYDYLVDYHYIDETYYTNFYDNVVAYDLQDSKNAADALYVQYSAVNPGMDENKYSYDESLVAYNAFAGFINNIYNYSVQVRNAVYTSGWQYLIDMREFFKCEINEAVMYFAENAYKSFETVITANITSEIETAKNHEANLTALYNEVVANAGTDKANQLLSALRTAAAAMIEGMYKTLAERFTAQVAEADKVYTEMGRPSKLDMVTYLQLSTPILALEDGWDKNYHPENYDDNADNNYNRGDNGIIGIQDVLDAAGKGSLISNATRTTWNNFINAIYETWLKYGVTYGFADYVQSQIQYADRIVMEGDELKTANDPVTEAEMLKLIEALDKIITSDTVGGLLGSLLGAEEGEAFNLGTMLSDLIKGALFTDEFINTVVQMLYPLVVKEFSKVWATLPTSIEYEGMDVTVRYKKSLNNILDEGKFQIFPDLLAKKLEELGYSTKYKDNIEMLKAAGGDTDAWESPKLVDYETGKLMLSWGVAEQKEKLDAGEISQAQFDAFFYQAFEDATAGLLPLLTTLITNKPWTPDKCTYIATGQVTVFIAPVTLNVDLQLGSTANSGYANLLVPVYELLGVPYTAVSTIESSTHNADIAYVLEQILAPIFTFLGKLGDAPVDTILEILPDLVYALTFRMAKPLLNMLNTTITYSASANIVGEVLADGALIEVGNMLITDADDAVLPNSAFTNGINSLLSFFGLNIPAIDQNTLATLGELTTMSTSRKAWIYDNSKIGSGKAYTIEADKADVGYYLLSYVLNVVKDEAALTNLLGMFVTDEASLANIKGIIYETLNLDEMNVGNAIAAIVELANQVEYDVGEYVWYDGTLGTPLGQTPAAEIYLDPNNDWTEEKAEYLYNNLENILYAIFSMAGLDLDDTTEAVDGTIEGALSKLLGDLFTGKTVTSLAKLLGSLSDLGALLAGGDEEAAEGEEATPEAQAEGEEAEEEAGLDIAEILNDLLKNELGIDLATAYGKYANIAEDVEVLDEFAGVNDAESFADALVTLLTPLSPVLDFILAGKDLTLINSAITLIGYNGYDNALIPLLEALGATPTAYTEGANALELTLDALVQVINKLTTNDPEVANDGAIYTIIDILPGVLYYISSNALSQGVDKLLTPVYAILDTIRPIYNIDLGELLAGIEIGEEGNKQPLGLDLKNLTWSFIFGLLEDLILKDIDLGTLFDELKVLIYDVSKIVGTEYDSASALESTWKKGAYSDNFTKADLITVLLSFVLDWATVEENAEALDTLLNTNGLIASIVSILDRDVEITYEEPDWMYWFKGDKEAFEEYLANPSRINTLATLDWDNITDNDWDLETAQYFADNIGELVDLIIGMINKDKEDAPKTLAALLDGLVNDNLGEYFTDETIDTLIGYISGVLANVDDVLLDIGYELLNVDLVGLKNYKCEKEITTLDEFLAELGDVLDTYAQGLLDLLFFGDDIRLAKKPGTNGPVDTIVINGGFGYEKGLAIILEALGCDVPDADKATATNVLEALAKRVDAILEAPVNEILDLLPNLVYALNANAAGVAVNNLLQPVNALLYKINGLGLLEKEININELLTVEIGGEKVAILENLQLANIVEIIEGATGLPLDAAADILVNFCTGKISEGKFGYKMEAAREDTLTILLVVALELIYDDAFTAKLGEILDTDIVTGIKGILEGATVTYKYPDWNYMDGIENGDVIEYVNAITSYPNDWTEEKAEYLAENLPALVDTVIKMVEINGVKYDSLAALLQANVNIFTTETLNSLLDLIKNLLGDIDAELLEVGFILDVNLPGLMAYEVPTGITTVDAFASELANVLNTYAKGVVEWLLLGRDFKLLVKDADGIGEGLVADGSYVTIKGAQGYAEGLALLLEALGCENLPAVYDVENLDTTATVKAVLASLAARIDEIFANPVEEVLDLLPNLIYFLDADGVDAVITNTTAALMALVNKLSVFGINLDINSLVDLPKLMGIADKYEEGDDVIALNNLTLKALLKALSLMTELDFTELQNVLVPFALGEAVKYDSVSANDAYKMVYKTDLDKHDMLSVIVTAALRMFVENDDNAAKLDKMIGTEIISALKDVFAEVEVEYEAPDWSYPLADNGTVDAMMYSITYPTNWTEETAIYVTENLVEIVDLVANLIDGNYETLSALLTDKVNVFTSENLQAIVDLIANLLDGIDEGLLDAAGVLLGADVVGLKAYKAPEGITTVEAFAAELANVLNTYAKGVVEWLLLGKDYKFFVKEVKNGAPVDFIVINGAEGYANGLALLLEALGCENLPAADGKTEDIVTGVLTSLAVRIDEIFANPVAEVLDLLPNLLYFLNTNGVAAVVENTLAAVTALLDKLEAFGINVDIKALVNLKDLMGIADTDATISLDDLSMKALLQAVGYMTELDLSKLADVLVGFALGKVDEYESVSDAKAVGTAKKMSYKEDFEKYDMITVIANLALITLADEANADFLKGLAGEEIYDVIVNILNIDTLVPDVKNMNWQYVSEETGGNKVGESITAIETSDLFKNFTYGPNFTKEMADYIAANFGTFVDNIIYLLGIEMDGETYESLSEILKELVGENVYNSANVVAIQNALAGFLGDIANLEVNGVAVGGYIVEVLKKSLDVDITAVAKVEVPEFTKDKDQFVKYLAEVLNPLGAVLKWLLTDEDIAFFVNEGKTDLIKLPGAEGYKTGLVLLLEALGCEDIVAPEALKDMTGAEMVIAIIDPLLNKVNNILDDPAEELLAVLPNLIYFINSNGVDVVVKNTLNAVCTLLEAISPVADIDLDSLIYDLVGLSLDEITTEHLIDMLLKDFEIAGFKFTGIEVNDIVGELSVGVLEEYPSLSHEDPAYRMVYDKDSGSADEGDMVTVLLRFIIKFISTDNNKAVLVDLLKSLGMGAEAEKYVTSLFELLVTCIADTKLGMDTALYTIYYIYYGVDLGAEEIATGKRDLNAAWQKKLAELSKDATSEETDVSDLITDIFDIMFNPEGEVPEEGGNDVLDKDGLASNGFLAFFARIKAFFQEIADFFRNLFSFGK